jgi:hypothetical protein
MCQLHIHTKYYTKCAHPTYDGTSRLRKTDCNSLICCKSKQHIKTRHRCSYTCYTDYTETIYHASEFIHNFCYTCALLTHTSILLNRDIEHEYQSERRLKRVKWYFHKIRARETRGRFGNRNRRRRRTTLLKERQEVVFIQH